MSAGDLAYSAAKDRDVGLPYITTVQAFNHGYDSRQGPVSYQTSAARTHRRFDDKIIHSVYEAPFLAPIDEKARIIGKCAMIFGQLANGS